MGISGLLSHCLEHRAECVQEVNLVEVAQSRRGIEILVDFYSFEHFVVRRLWRSLARVTQNPLVRVLGGEYELFDKAFKKLYTDLKAVGITLAVFIDGAKGSCKVMTQQKLDTWKYRHKNDMGKLAQLTDVLEGRRQMEDVPDDVSVRPVLLEVQVVTSLRAAGCEIIQCPTGEADFVLAKNLLQRPKAFAILSNDSDFCIFKDCAFIPNDLFDLENDLYLGEGELVPRAPTDRLKVGVIYTARVGASLQLSSPEDLVELSIIAGNDFTAPFLRGRLRGRYDLNGRRVGDAARWVTKYRRVDNHPAIKHEMNTNKEFALRVERSRLFYSVSAQEEGPSREKHYLTQYIEDQVRHGRYPANVVSMHLGFYWYRMLLEDCSPGAPSCEAALADLRSHVYTMLLGPRGQGVIEYGRTPDQLLASAPVYASPMRGLPQVTAVDPDKVFQNLRTFARVMTHYEPHFQPRYFEKYGRKRGFTLYVLRYFLNMNVGYGLHVSRPEVWALVATVLGRPDVSFYQGLHIHPSLRCVTVGNWFQDLYRHAYLFLGCLLNLTHEFPEPWEVFSGAVWTAFYMVGLHAGDLRGGGGVSGDAVRRVQQEQQAVVHDHRHMLEHVVDGFFPFHSRF